MSCKFYTWNGDYSCTKTGERVDEDWYYKYCRNYDYDDCPIYKGESSSGGCYQTSACVEAMGLPDDCQELTVLRQFRDNWLANQPGGQKEIETYYQVAPLIVTAIRKQADARTVFQWIYDHLVSPCVSSILAGNMVEAWNRYREITHTLQEQYT